MEKLKAAYRYGADSVYVGLSSFSLRAKADNFPADQAEEAARIKGKKKLYCAVNIYFHPGDLKRLDTQLEHISRFSFDAFIVSDLGAAGILREAFPGIELHLSTQANCINAESAKFYRDAGFSRIILGRELSLAEIADIRREVPDVELEAFVHGAMCLAYSGRCFLSAWMAGRSGNQGMCAHSCRWDYRLLEERERPGEYLPVYEGDGFTSILSSKDICMIDHLPRLKDAGIDAVKIEGRMKSVYYTALVTRAYRKFLDNPAADPAYRDELFRLSRREYTTGFYFGRDEIEEPASRSYLREGVFLASVGEPDSLGRFRLDTHNRFSTDETIEFIGPDVPFLTDSSFELFDEEGNPVTEAVHQKIRYIKPSVPAEEGWLIRKRGQPSISSTASEKT
jgi:putative protease